MDSSSGPGGQEVARRKVGRGKGDRIRVSFLVGLGEEGIGGCGIGVGMRDGRFFKTGVVVDVNDGVGFRAEIDPAGR